MADQFPELLLDLVDEEWMKEVLPDDEVPLPQGIPPPGDLLDDDIQDVKPEDPNKWTDLGLQNLQ